ncbi:MAG: hypothetical protein OEZ01_14010, partial [Candidatus Heimdallarchaeota archaeon]|nr:hypothetical protein [Candidatus Heimdallarchaeota archaeon]
MVEQFNLINSEKVPKCLFHGRINELKSTSIVEILGEKIKISINQIFQDNYLPKQMIFIISHDYEGEVIIKKGIYDIIYFKFGVNLLTLTKERKINPIFTEFQKIVDIFVNKRYLDVIIFINELLENDDINLSNMDIFRLFCLQSHSFLKAGLTNKAKYSLTQARSQLINIDGSFLKLDGKDNFSFNNPYSNYIFFDYGYLSGDLAYLLFLEIIYGIQTNVRSSELIEKINEGMAYTEEKNYTFFQEFSFLKLLVQNNGISKSELEEFQKFFSENTNIFFKLLIQGSLKKEEIFLNNGLNSDIKEDLKSMINEFNTSGIISKRLYSE